MQDMESCFKEEAYSTGCTAKEYIKALINEEMERRRIERKKQ